MNESDVKYAFMSMDDMVDEEEEYIKKLQREQRAKHLRVNEAVEKKTPMKFDDNERTKQGNAYFYARTGDVVDVDGSEYEIITDEEGNHRIGYSDEIYLKDTETGDVRVIDKEEFIEKARLLEDEERKFGVWQSVEAKKYTGKELVGFVAKNLTKDEAEKTAEYLTDKYGKYGKCTYEVREVKNKNEALVEEPVYELEPKRSHQKSFYDKARVEVLPGGTQILWSYSTPVAKIENGKATLLRRGYLGWFSSPTTLKHVRDFLSQNGFEVGSKSELQKMYETEVYESTESKGDKIVESNEMKVNLADKEEVEKGKETLETEVDETTEKIVDVDANTVDELKDSYVGNVILQCPVCRTLIYKKPDALVFDEETEVYNKGESCPHCGSEDGFGLVGQVAEYSVDFEPEDDSTTGKEDDLVDIEPEKEEEEEPVEEVEETETEIETESLANEFDDASFDNIVTKFLTETYDNVYEYDTTDVSFDGKTFVVEGIIKYKSGKQRSTEFSLASAKSGLMEGLNRTLSSENKPFSFVCSTKNGTITFESMSYDLGVVDADEKYRLKGSISAR